MFRLLSLVFIALLSVSVARAQTDDQRALRFLKHNAPAETWSSALWRVLAGQTKPKQVAVLVGVSKYLKLGAERQLQEVDVDLDKLEAAFRDKLGFDRIFVIKNESVTRETLKFFLETYLPNYFKDYPGSRLVFAYSGHGFTNDKREGFLMTQMASAIRGDEKASIAFSDLRDMLRTVTRTTLQTLVLINSCESGSFFPKAFGEKPAEMFYEGHWGIVSSRESELSFAYPLADRKPAGSSFFEAFQEAIVEGKADRVSPEGTKDGYITYFDLVAYMKERVGRLHEGKVTPKMGDLPPGSWDGAFVFATKQDATVVQGQRAAQASKSFGARPFPGQVEHLIVKQAFQGEQILGDDGWMSERSLVNRVVTRGKSSSRTAPVRHIVIGYTFTPNRDKNSIAAIRRGYSDPQFPASVHFVTYRDASIDQFLPLSERPWSIGRGNQRGIDNGTVVSVWLDSVGVMSGRAPDGDSWLTFYKGIKPAAEVVEAEMTRVSTHLLDQPNCTLKPEGSTGWEKQTRQQLVAAESLIDQLVTKLQLPRSRDSIVALNEVVCHKFAPGPALNPWIACMKDRVAAGQSVGGCVKQLPEQAVLTLPRLGG